ncbi:hypothetical protein [Actinocrispum wychmicini]|uniref:Uncharacterized protein n=1 Tax=Actinocrispum wychmicini TaxID=1213861 RepID=A0A4R2K1I4_9PSEU|nr:hypothetical protein [Actinocrispum wychmicini]TCO65567.1 hypothetical protein EV192_1011359 [Actinocrispum wychmicini]
MDLARLRTWHRPLLAGVGFMIVTLLLSIGGLLFDDRTLLGEPIWLKPFKFSVSIAIYGFTLAWLLSLLKRGRRTAWWMGTITSLVLVIETAVIIGQVFRGTESHFNVSTPLNDALWQVMAVSIVVLWLSNAVIGVFVLLERSVDRPMLWALRIGFGLALIGMAVAFMMPPPTPDQLALLKSGVKVGLIGGHSVGVPDGGPGMPITHWSTTGGDLRIPHFVGIHALQALPLLALFLGRFSRLDTVVRTRLVLVGGFAYAGLLAIVWWQALRGQSLTSPDGATAVAFVALVVVTLAAGAMVLRSRTPIPPREKVLA